MTSATWIPSSHAARARLASLVIGLFFVGVQGLQLGVASDPGSAKAISTIALVLLLAILVATGIMQRQLSIWEGPATGVLAILVGIGLHTPLAVISICIGVVIAHSLYGSGTSEVLRIMSLLPVLPASIALSIGPISDSLTWYSPASLAAIPPIALIGGVLHLIKGALITLEEAEQRAQHMADLTGDLLASETIEQSSRIVVAATEEMCRLSPGVVIVGCYLRNPPGQPSIVTVGGIYGARPDNRPSSVPIDIITGLPRLDRENPDATRGAQRRLSAALGLPGERRWYVHGDDDPIGGVVANLGLFGVPKGLSERLFGRPGPRATELLAALRSFSEQRRTAFDYLLEKEALVDAASRDDITGLTKRAPFLQRLDELMATEPGQVWLIVVSLDGLQQLVQKHGMAVASMATSRAARLMLGLVGDRGHIGRLSDSRFAIAVPAAGGGHVEGLVQVLRKALSEPVQLGEHDLTLSIRAGVSRSAAGTSSRELVERAIFALRLDREPEAEPMARRA